MGFGLSDGDLFYLEHINLLHFYPICQLPAFGLACPTYSPSPSDLSSLFFSMGIFLWQWMGMTVGVKRKHCCWLFRLIHTRPSLLPNYLSCISSYFYYYAHLGKHVCALYFLSSSCVCVCGRYSGQTAGLPFVQLPSLLTPILLCGTSGKN